MLVCVRACVCVCQETGIAVALIEWKNPRRSRYVRSNLLVNLSVSLIFSLFLCFLPLVDVCLCRDCSSPPDRLSSRLSDSFSSVSLRAFISY